MPKPSPIPADEAAYVAGAQIYKDDCAVCHGLPRQAQTAIAEGMFPKPPKLMEGTGVTDDSPAETYWKVAGGIRMTGMPGFDKTLSPTQMWQVSLLLANADKLPLAVKNTLTSVATPAPTPPAHNMTK
jgi:thiosulfate dehydrogenase